MVERRRRWSRQPTKKKGTATHFSLRSILDKEKNIYLAYSFFLFHIQQQQKNARTRKHIVIGQRSSSLDNLILISFRNQEETAVFVSENCSPANQATNIISLALPRKKRQRCSQTGSRLSQFIFSQQQRLTYTTREWAARTWKIEKRRKKKIICAMNEWHEKFRKKEKNKSFFLHSRDLAAAIMCTFWAATSPYVHISSSFSALFFAKWSFSHFSFSIVFYVGYKYTRLIAVCSVVGEPW